MFLSAVGRLYDYQSEVNNHLLDVASRISRDEFTSVLIEGQPSIRDTLVHMVGVIQINVSWWDGSMDGSTSFDREFLPHEYPDISSVKIFWAEVDSQLRSFINSLENSSDLEREYQRSLPDGEIRTRVLWEMMLHVINHGTQHRSEVAIMLTKLGYSPGDMEIL